MKKPMSNNTADGLVKSKQNESRDRNKVNVEVVIDEKQIEREIDRAMRNAINKLNE